ncbi:MAG: tetratricopeptide repeat protein [Desulfobacterales bacterium]
MAKNKKLPKDNQNRAKQNAVLGDTLRESPKSMDKIQLIKFDRYQALFLALLVLVGVIIYANTLQAPFVFDDQDAITNNSFIRMEEISAKSIIDAATGYGKSRPLPMLTFGLNYYFGQYNVLGYHLVNIFIHLINGILLFFFLKLTLTLSNQQTTDSRKFDPITISALSFFTALLWLVNPVQTQSVTYIVQRMTSMGAIFYLLALILYAKGRIAQRLSVEDGDARSKHYYLWFAGCLMAGLLALGSKESTAMLPVFIFLYEWYFFQDLDKNWLKRRLKYLAAIVILSGVVAGLYLGFDPLGKFNTLRDYVFKEFTIGERLLTQTRVVIYYLSLIFYPNPSRLNLDYDFPLSYSLFNPFTTFLSLIIIVALIALGLYLARKQRLISFCILWFFGNLVIESSVIPLALIFEHRLYLPSMFVFLLIVILFYRYIKPAWLTAVIACAVVAVCSYWTYERNIIWQDDLALWMDCNKKAPNKARPYLNVAEILTNRKQYDEALPNILKALQINPYFVDAHYNLGVLFDKKDEPVKAIEHYRKALELQPDNEKANNNLGVALLKQDLTEEAIIHLQRALKKDPTMADAHINLGVAFSKQDKLDEALVQYSKALQISSNLPKAQFGLGEALVRQGQIKQGVHHIKRALEIDPEHAEAHNNLGGQLLQEGKIDEALGHFNAALKTNPDMAEANNNTGIILIHKGRISEAIFHFQEAVRINPEFELAQDNLRRALAIQQNQMDTEMERLRAALKSSPDDPVLNYVLGNLYLGKGELNNAIGQFQKALSLQPNFPQALNNLAMAHIFAGQYDQALEAFQKLIALQPDNAANYYNVAVLYALQTNVTESLAWLNQAVAKGYDNWDLIKTDKDLENIRNSEGYRELVKGR